MDKLKEFLKGWQPIETMPRNVNIDTKGVFHAKAANLKYTLTKFDENISDNTVYPLVTTYFEHNGMVGTYTRTEWRLTRNDAFDECEAELRQMVADMKLMRGKLHRAKGDRLGKRNSHDR